MKHEDDASEVLMVHGRRGGEHTNQQETIICNVPSREDAMKHMRRLCNGP